MPKLTLVFALAVSSLGWSPCAAAQARLQPQAQQDLQKLLGPNVFLFSPSTPAAQMQAQINKVYAEQEHAEFGSSRYAFLFLPGDYHLDLPVGFYTQAIGLGAAPSAVHLTGNMHADASLPHNNATCTFWRAAEGLTVTPSTGTLQWATSQAISFRRMHVLGNMVLHQNRGWASGGWISDSVIDGNVDSGTQQQWISRNTEWGSWTGSNWNMVFVGVTNPPPGDWPKPAYTKIERTPISREKPFLFADSHGNLSVLVPNLQHNTVGVTWHNGTTPGRSVPLSHFYVAHPGDTAATINAALATGKDLLITPGIYDLTEPISVTRKDTIVLGLGYATLLPINGTPAMIVADVDGVTISGLLFDAGEKQSPVLLEVGPPHSSADHAANPASLHDVFFRVGGATVGKVAANLIINSNNVLVDHTWIWRADHGHGIGWTLNTSDNGLIVNGDDVTAYGLFVEHHQQFQVLWNGERGRTYFYQSEIPYDPPDQPSWRSAPNLNGWAAYKVADTVHDHEAFGLGIYSVFRHPDVTLTQAIEVPELPTVRFHHIITVALGNLGEITSVIDGTGGAAKPNPRVTPRVELFPSTASAPGR